MSREPRYRLRAFVDVTYVAGNSRGEGRVEDVSRNGFFIRSTMLPADGSQIEAILKTNGGTLIAVEGRVCWNTASVPSKLTQSGFGVYVSNHGAEYVGFVEGVIAAGEQLVTTVTGT